MTNKETILMFEDLFDYNVNDFLVSYNSFLQMNYPKILSFFNGSNKKVDSDSFDKLYNLRLQLNEIFEIISLNSNVLYNFRWFDFIFFFEKIDDTLLKIENISKWLRSSVSDSNVSLSPQIDVSLKQGETLESFTRTFLNDSNWDNKWVDIALSNDLIEEDYTSDGGNLLKVSFEKGVNVFEIKSIVDTITGENILGKDLYYKTTFIDDDIMVLEPKNTFIQSVEIIVKLKKGDCPEFPSLGQQEKFIIGTNIASLSFPTIIRQFVETMRTDDTIKSSSIKSIRREQDAAFIDFQVQSRKSDLIISSLPVS